MYKIIKVCRFFDAIDVAVNKSVQFDQFGE